jgi:hypothetical protein
VGSGAEITIDDFSQPAVQTVSSNGPPATGILTGLSGVLGESRRISVAPSFTGVGPFALVGSVSGGRAEADALVRAGQVIFEWNANGAGLDLDLNPFGGISFGRGDSDAAIPIFVRLISSPGNYFLLQSSTGASDGIGYVDLGCCYGNFTQVLYGFGSFAMIGNPSWGDINAIQFELNGVGSAGTIDSVKFVSLPAQVPERGSSPLMFAGVLMTLITWRHWNDLRRPVARQS